jgi:hypothetical protein
MKKDRGAFLVCPDPLVFGFSSIQTSRQTLDISLPPPKTIGVG